MRAASIHVLHIMKMRNALASGRIWHTDREVAAIARNAVSPRIRPEVLIERPVLLHDDNDVFDLVNPLVIPFCHRGVFLCSGVRRAGDERNQNDEQSHAASKMREPELHNPLSEDHLWILRPSYFKP